MLSENTDDNIRSVKMAAWYTDLTHWVDKVTSGNRVVLQFDVNSNAIPSRNSFGDTKKAELEMAEEGDTKLSEDSDGINKVVKLYGEHDSSLFQIYRESVNEERFMVERPALVDHIRNWLESHPKEEVAILLHHRYLLRALENEILKGSDLWLFESLKGHFDIEFLSIAIDTILDRDHEGGNFVSVTEVVADPIYAEDLESLLIGGDGTRGTRTANSMEEVTRTMLFLGNRTRHLDILDHTPYIEFTGNEPQMGRDTYMTTCMVLRKKA